MHEPLVSDMKGLIRSGDFAHLRDRLVGLLPQEIAAIIQHLKTDEQVLAFRVLPRNVAATVFEYLPSAAQRSLVKSMGQEDIAALLNHMAPDDRTLLFGELPANVTKRHQTAVVPPDARRAPRGGDASRISARHDRPLDDAALHRRSRRLDGSTGDGFCSGARSRQ
jgi:magnesium transporter